MRLRFYNKTSYPTGPLRSFCVQGIKELGAEGKVNAVYIQYKKSPNQRRIGYARYTDKSVTINVDRFRSRLDEFSGTLQHEVQHLLGLRHKDMIGGRMVRFDKRHEGTYICTTTKYMVKDKIPVLGEDLCLVTHDEN